MTRKYGNWGSGLMFGLAMGLAVGGIVGYLLHCGVK